MRMIVVKPGNDLQALAQRLLKPGAAHSEGALERLKRVNPHLDFARLEPGAVLLVPDDADFSAGEAASIGGEAFDSLASDAMAGLKAAGVRIRAGLARQEAQRKEVNAAFDSETFRRLVQADQALNEQAERAQRQFEKDQRRARETEAMLELLENDLAAELEALKKIVG